ncbi:polysaccharide lyase family 1 protein [Uliginosibacterium paludis]|uniref:Pectate lyase n=1 Tax=Uliginosibacterium paludis TaxID=1615952 RepID=A0ABV2CLV8_9RHOO
MTGWAAVNAAWYSNSSTSSATTGGNAATSAKTYTVTSRTELIQALYGNSATINANGTIASGTLDSSAKIIYISGTIDLNTNKAGTSLTESDYICAVGTSYAYSSSVTSVTALYSFDAYKTQYDPNGAWKTNPVDKSGDPLEVARACAAANQKKVVYISIPSNTSLIGKGASAKIINGSLVIGASSSAPVDNVVVRNISFENAFDMFPQWDPTDSGGRWNSAYDNVSVMYATHVWIDHNTFSDGSNTDDLYPPVFAAPYNEKAMKVQHHDGLLDITKNANYVTVSWNHFHDHDKTNLIGGTDTVNTTTASSAENPNALKITFHHNYWKNIEQRQPRVRYGMVHVYNNYYEGKLDSSATYTWTAGMVAGQGGKLYMENNVFAISGGTASESTVYSGSSDSTKADTCRDTMNKTTSTYTPSGTYASTYCSAYAYGTGNVLNGSAIDLSGVTAGGVTWTSTPWFASGLISGTPTATPSSYYNYTPDSTASLATSVANGAGAGKF